MRGPRFAFYCAALRTPIVSFPANEQLNEARETARVHERDGKRYSRVNGHFAALARVRNSIIVNTRAGHAANKRKLLDSEWRRANKFFFQSQSVFEVSGERPTSQCLHRIIIDFPSAVLFLHLMTAADFLSTCCGTNLRLRLRTAIRS